MLADARSVPDKTTITADLCIVGAGAAGITLAREFIGHPFRVCLLESGGLELDSETQSLYEGENLGHRYRVLGGAGDGALTASRIRGFGGTTRVWGGYCRPLDEIDFEPRDWIPYSGWPFPRSHLVPFYHRAQAVLQLGPFAYSVDAWETHDAPRLPFTSRRATTRIYQVTRRGSLGDLYRREIAGAANVTAYLHANVVEIETTSNARSATRVQVATLEGRTFRVAARLFVLAAGGIENARLLLLSDRVQPGGLGNQNDWVGRCFMDHQEKLAAYFLPSNAHIPMGLYRELAGRAGWGVLGLSDEALRREKLANCTLGLQTTGWPGRADPAGVASLRHLIRGVRSGEVPEKFLAHLRNVIADMDDVAVAAYRKFVRRPPALYRLDSACEKTPNPASRVMLSREVDRIGKRRIRLDWWAGSLSDRTIRRTAELIGLELGRAGLGRLMIPREADPAVGQHHHMGTTRMHADPRRGVVNEDCRIHGVSNLFVAGSSVFPTSGSATPTLTIVALALRLADHLKRLAR